MAIVFRQVPVGSGTAVSLLSVPSGESVITITNAGTAAIYLGSGTAVSTANGHPVPAGQTMTFTTYPGSASSTIYAIATVNSTAVGFTVSSAQ